MRGRRDRLEGGGGEGEELLKQEADQTPVGTPVDKLIAVVDESLIAVLLEGNIVVQELLHQDVHRDLSLAPLLLERIVLLTGGERRAFARQLSQVVVQRRSDERRRDSDRAGDADNSRQHAARLAVRVRAVRRKYLEGEVLFRISLWRR